MPTLLHEPTIVGGRKPVDWVNKPYFYKTLTAAQLATIKIIQHVIEDGRTMPSQYYRLNYLDYDWVLDTHGYVHLRIGGDERLWLAQFDDRVVFMCVTGHDVFDEKPAASSIKKRHGVALQMAADAPARELPPSQPFVTIKKPKRDIAQLRASKIARDAIKDDPDIK